MRKKEGLARIVAKLTEEVNEKKAELAELREELAGMMKPGEIIELETARVKLCETEEKILVSNVRIMDLIGKKRFMEVAKVSCGALKTALEATAEDKAAAGAIFNLCVESFSKNTVLKVLKGGAK